MGQQLLKVVESSPPYDTMENAKTSQVSIRRCTRMHRVSDDVGSARRSHERADLFLPFAISRASASQRGFSPLDGWPTRIPVNASRLPQQAPQRVRAIARQYRDKSRMRESRTSGSVRSALSPAPALPQHVLAAGSLPSTHSAPTFQPTCSWLRRYYEPIRILTIVHCATSAFALSCTARPVAICVSLGRR
jgi:hypothetical protein